MNGNEILGHKKIVYSKVVTHTYAFTWNPDPNKRFGRGKVNRLDELEHDFKMIVQCFHQCAYFIIVPELTVMGNLHYHGVLRIFDRVKLYKFALPKLEGKGFICLKSDPNKGWDEYINKDVEFMSDLFDRKFSLPFVYSETFNIKQLRHTLSLIRLEAEQQPKDYNIYSFMGEKFVEYEDDSNIE